MARSCTNAWKRTPRDFPLSATGTSTGSDGASGNVADAAAANAGATGTGAAVAGVTETGVADAGVAETSAADAGASEQAGGTVVVDPTPAPPFVDNSDESQDSLSDDDLLVIDEPIDYGHLPPAAVSGTVGDDSSSQEIGEFSSQSLFESPSISDFSDKSQSILRGVGQTETSILDNASSQSDHPPDGSVTVEVVDAPSDVELQVVAASNGTPPNELV